MGTNKLFRLLILLLAGAGCLCAQVSASLTGVITDRA